MADDDLSPLDLDPKGVSNLLHAEAAGLLPEWQKSHLERARTMGLIPPPLLGGADPGALRQRGNLGPIPKPPEHGLTSMAVDAANMLPDRSTIQRQGKAVLDTVADPEAMAATVGGFLGPEGIVGGSLAAGSAAAAMAGGREAYQATTQGRPANYSGTMGPAFASGAVGEAMSRAIPTGSPMTQMGQKTQQLLGDKAMIPDLIQSPGWDFARNVAREGFLGRGKMLAREQENAGTLLGKVSSEARGELPQPAAPVGPNKVQTASMLNPSKEMAGREAQNQLRTQFVDKSGEAKGLYKDFMGKFGGLKLGEDTTSTDAITGGSRVVSKAPTLKDVHARRSAALEAGRDAANANDYVGQMKAMREVHDLTDTINTHAPEPVSAAYNQLSTEYGRIMGTYDNPTVRNLREGKPAEELMDAVLNPKQGLKTFAPFREMHMGGDLPTVAHPHQSVSLEDAVHLTRDALGEEKFKQFRADALQTLGQDSTKMSASGASEGLDGAAITKRLKAIPPNVQNALFGPSTAQNVNKIADVAASTQKARSGTGALWIVMRQPSAALGLGAGIWEAGHMTGNDATGKDIGIGTTGAILLSPLILSAIIRSPRATSLFVKALGAEPTLKSQLIKRLATQIPTEAIREAVTPRDAGSSKSIPEPPAAFGSSNR